MTSSYDIKGTLDDLTAGITGEADRFGFTPRELADQLQFVAIDYVVAQRDHQSSTIRGVVLKNLEYVIDGDENAIGRRITILDDDAVEACFGQYPSSLLKLHGTEEYGDVFVPAHQELEVSAIKKMATARFRSGQPGLFKAEFQPTGLERFGRCDRAEKISILQSLAAEDASLLKKLLQRVVQNLKNTFQINDGQGGRNQRVNAGFVSPADWQLINGVLDIIWPIDNGQMHSHMMKHARQIVDQVIIYVKCDPDNPPLDSDREYLFDSGWFSSILTYRHQINTLRKAVLFIEERILNLEASPDRRTKIVGQRLERLRLKALYPLHDWFTELKRRLNEADYRTGNENVRRPTGGFIGFPDVPRLKKGLAQSAITLKLLHALANYSGKKVPPNKGMKKVVLPES
ncbi:hypothetical protein R5W60_02760 [Brucella pseudintermedia]|uniref:hypothetical protein n=1 Tax=Brucella pseudintermedia TaxID=370111 RepID=UPI00366B4CE9|nr:hypothetical protein R5W60_02760 [Brucella pseudintermedia]